MDVPQIEELKQKIKGADKEKFNKPPRERKSRFDMRKKARRSIADLTSILTKIGNLDSSENDYALIFREDKSYFEMLEACNLAYMKSFESKVRLRQYPQEYYAAIQLSCIRSGMKVPTQKQLSNRHLRTGVFECLKKKNPVEYENFWNVFSHFVCKKHEKMIEEQVRKEPSHMRSGNSKDLDLYSERMKEQSALQIATRVFERILEEDKEFLKKPLEQIVEDFQKERDSAMH